MNTGAVNPDEPHATSAVPLAEFPPAPSVAAQYLATLLSVAIRIEPELIRAMRLGVAPHLDVSAEVDLWFSEWVGTRSAEAIVLLPGVRAKLHERLEALLRQHDRSHPVYQVWAQLAEVHADASPALLLEEQVTWLAVNSSDDGDDLSSIEDALVPALRAFGVERRSGLADWFAAAWRRLPPRARRTKTAWQLAQVVAQHLPDNAELLAGPIPPSLRTADVTMILAAFTNLQDIQLGVRREGSNLLLGDVTGEGAAAVLVPDTRPRLVNLEWTVDGVAMTRSVAVSVGEIQQMQVGPGPVRLHTARGVVYESPVPVPVHSGRPSRSRSWPAVELADVQGLVLRGYTMPVARYIGLSVRESVTARTFLAALVDSDLAMPSITSARPWAVKPDYCVNLGITFPGLASLGVPPTTLASFPEEYREGAVQRAASVGDVGTSATDRWLPWLVDPELHLLVTLFAQSADVLDSITKQLNQAWVPGYVELGRHDGACLPGDTMHFGYHSGLSQPTIEGVPASGLPDQLPRTPIGEFLLGYPSQFDQFSYPVPTPPELGINGSFAAFRVLEQDVDGFAEFITQQATRTGMPESLIEAKLCGRWRNGTPLVLSPDTDNPDPPIPPQALNDFDYVGEYRDEWGYRCPIGSHIRRMYPRGQRVAGDGGHLHRIIRRGIPYGPPYDPAHPRDGQARGLLGLFIGVSLRDQFEFLMRHWANTGNFTAGLSDTKDPLIGAHTDGAGSFSIPQPQGPMVLHGLARFVTTRGGAYCFLPSISGIRYLADLAPPS
jgi:deferrochelatase/peroxidase EfeB